MKARKRILSLLLSVVMLLGLLPTSALAASTGEKFSDVKPADWFYEAVQYVCDNGMMNGMGNNTFAPNATTTRGMIVTILARMEGVDTNTGSPWYTAGCAWAVSAGISDGTDMEGQITREQLAAMLYRYAQLKGYDTSAGADISGFTDSSSTSGWAEAAMQWAVGTGLINGVGENTLDPQGSATRAQVATILMRFCQFFAGADDPAQSPEDSKENNKEENKDNSGSDSNTPVVPDVPVIWPDSGEDEDNKDETADDSDYVAVDIDGDGVPDWLEEYLGTSDTNNDSDGDGISDYDEIYVVGSDPAVWDSNEDEDDDGLTNFDEVNTYHTNPIKADTDNDGLTDYDEINTYHTDPLVYDTDGDGVSDGREIELGTDPLVANSSFKIVQNSTNTDDTVSASVEIELSGNQVETLAVEAVDNPLFFPKNMPGYLGMAYDFSVAGGFGSAVIRFAFDASILESGAEPTIFYFNEAEQTLEELETTIVGNVASAVVEHFSTYILIDRKIYYNSFTWEDVWDTEGTFHSVEIVLVIDDSGSMTSNDRSNQRLTVAQNLIDKLPEDSKIGIVWFASSNKVLTSELLTDREAAKAYLTTEHFKSSGGTYMYTAIGSAFDLFESTDADVLKMMVVLSDGDTSDTGRHSATIAAAQTNNVRIYTVGLGNSTTYFTKYLKPLAESTGGAFYLAADADELASIYDDINKKIDLEADADGDGIPDYYEDNMIAFNGVKIALDKNNPDTDGDGLRDGEEVEVQLIYSEDGAKVYVKGKLRSDPTLEDTDFDGRKDKADASPMNNRFSGELATDYADSSISFKMDYRWFFKDNTVYNKELSKTSLLLSSAIYSGNDLAISDSTGTNHTNGTSLPMILKFFGFAQNAKTESLGDYYDDIHLSEVGLGYHTVTYNGATKNIVAIVVRGTNKSIAEWSSNFDIGDSRTFGTTSDWVTAANHAGFDIAANRIMKIVDDYMRASNLSDSNTVFWITGHSRGAAIANIIGAYYEQAGKTAFTYTFAAPNTTLASNTSSYRSIFNIVNADDFVPCLPMAAWGYTRYGRTASVSIASKYEREWESLTSIWDYNPDTYGMDDTISALSKILTGDARIECYEYTCTDHGDGSNDTITIKNYGMSKDSREKAINKIPANALPYCKITRYDGGLVSGWDFEVCQTPAYFMQILAAQMAGKIDKYRFVVELNIAKRYENAKKAIIYSAIGGLEHPHYTESYYVLANHIGASQFK